MEREQQANQSYIVGKRVFSSPVEFAKNNYWDRVPPTKKEKSGRVSIGNRERDGPYQKSLSSEWRGFGSFLIWQIFFNETKALVGEERESQQQLF